MRLWLERYSLQSSPTPHPLDGFVRSSSLQSIPPEEKKPRTWGHFAFHCRSQGGKFSTAEVDWIRTFQRTLNYSWYPSKQTAGADSAEIWEQKESGDLSVWQAESRLQMWRGVKSHLALMQRHLKRFIDHFIDLISCTRAKIKLDTPMTFAATLPMNRVVHL